jgi:hypothetical protein
MRSIEHWLRHWLLCFGAVAAFFSQPPAYAFTPPQFAALNRNHCLASGNWYGFYRDNQRLTAICLKLPEAFSVKMLDGNGDGVVDNNETISNGVIYVGEDSVANEGNGESGNESDSSDDISPGVEKSVGSRRIMWRQIQ